MSDDRDIKIAVLEKEVELLHGALAQHKLEDSDMFKSVWKDLKEGLDTVQNDMKTIFAFINQSKGKDAIRTIVASSIGGIIVAVLSAVMTHFLH